MITLYCTVCRKPFDVKPYRINAKYCSPDCRNTGAIGRKPSNTGIYTARIELICEYCQKPFIRESGRLKHGRGKHCSKECQYAAIKLRPSDANEIKVCIGCGKSFEILKTKLLSGRGEGKYCSRSCRNLYRHGENHPQYMNGTAQERRGPNWQAQRRKALKRDNHICQDCGLPGNDVHHIKPFRWFGIERYKEANELDNLVTLCDRCHRLAETEIQRTERNTQTSMP